MTRRFRIGILIVLAVFLSYLAYLVLVPFFIPITWAAVVAIVFYPAYLAILRRLKRPSLAALSSVALVLIIILGPLSYLSYFLVGELQDLSNAGLTMEGMRLVYRNSFVNSVVERMLPAFHLNEQQAMAYVANGLSNLSRELLHWIPAGLGSVANGLVHFLIMAFILFFLFKDGSVYASKILEYLPFSERDKERLSGQVRAEDQYHVPVFEDLVRMAPTANCCLIAYLPRSIKRMKKLRPRTAPSQRRPNFTRSQVYCQIPR